MKKVTLCFIVLLSTTKALHAQTPVLADDIILTPSFFITILSGVILALVFQFLLTAVSVAAGVTAIGDVKKKYAKAQANPGGSSKKDDHVFEQDYSSDTPMGVKLTTAFGIWSVLTTCIALFGATALALNLSTIESSSINITVALVIWGFFFLILFYLETKIASTLIGNLISTATSGLKASASAISSMFSSSPESKIEDVLDHTLQRVRSEFDKGFDSDKISGVLDKFLSKVDHKIPDYDNLKKDLENIAEKSSNKNTSGKWNSIQQVLTKSISENSDSSDPEKQSKAKKLQETLRTINEKFKEKDGGVEGAKNVVAELTSVDEQEIDKKMEQVKKYLSTSDESSLSGDKLNQALKGMLNHPKMTASILSDQVKSLDKNKLIELLSSNTNLKKENLEKYGNQVSSVIEKITKEFDSDNDERLTKRIEGQVAHFFNSTGRQELDYDSLKQDFQHIMDDPKDSLSVIKNRLGSFDEDTLKALVTNNKYIDESQIDRIVHTISDSKKKVLDKVSEIETKAHEQIEMAKRKAVIQAEHARETAASAAWWLVLSAILSAVAAMGGSMLPL